MHIQLYIGAPAKTRHYTVNMRKIKSEHMQGDGPLHVWPDVWSGDLHAEKSIVIHDIECPNWDQMS